jgi:hypothetical protein
MSPLIANLEHFSRHFNEKYFPTSRRRSSQVSLREIFPLFSLIIWSDQRQLFLGEMSDQDANAADWHAAPGGKIPAI